MPRKTPTLKFTITEKHAQRNCHEYPETTHLSSFSLASLKAPQWSLDIANVERPSPPLTGAQTQQYCYNNHFLMMSTRIYKIFIVTQP